MPLELVNSNPIKITLRSACVSTPAKAAPTAPICNGITNHHASNGVNATAAIVTIIGTRGCPVARKTALATTLRVISGRVKALILRYGPAMRAISGSAPTEARNGVANNASGTAIRLETDSPTANDKLEMRDTAA